MNRIQANVLIAGPESEARILKIFTPGATVAITPEEAIAAIDNQSRGFDVIVSAATFSDGSKASNLINYADERAASRISNVLLFSADPDALEAQQRAIPQAETILSPFEAPDYQHKLQNISKKRK